jgi:hypothetical protein
MKQLINYITVVPAEDDHTKGHKYPFLVNELFALDNSKINEKFFSEEIYEEPSKKEDDSEDETKS